MSRRKGGHEDHVNHEAWAIPYGDLITLLLAFFVVMYAVSSINEGKYRVLSDALSKAFGGPPKSLQPIQFGRNSQRGTQSDQRMTPIQTERAETSIGGTMRALRNPQVMPGRIITGLPQHQVQPAGNTGYEREKLQMSRLADAIERALGELVRQDLVRVRQTPLWLEVEVKTDILFASGVATLNTGASGILTQLGALLKPFPNRIRIEGYTDDRPIRTTQFPTNWELSAARAAGVVRQFIADGIAPARLSVTGYGEYQPVAGNDTEAGRNRNRRVLIVILSDTANPRSLRPPEALALPLLDPAP